jgi:hypothetical protein
VVGVRRAAGARRVVGVRRVVVASVVALLVAFPAAAAAHGGILLGSAVAGPYRTQVMAAPLVRPGRSPAIDVTVYLADPRTNTPITDATVRTAVTVDGRTLRPPVRAIGGGYEAIVPVGDAYTVGRQRIVVDVSGARGAGRVVIDPMPEGGGPPPALLAVSGALVLVLVVVAMRTRRARARTGDPAGETAR